MDFPCCPFNIGNDPLDDYVQSIRAGAVFAYSDDPADDCSVLSVERVVRLKDRPAILVLCDRAGAGWAIVGVEVSNGRLPHFIHFNLGAYQSEVEANDGLAKMATAKFYEEAYKNARYR